MSKTTDEKMKNECPICEIKIPLSQAFCGNMCKEIYKEQARITIPKSFIRRLEVHCSKDEKKAELVEYAKKHNFNFNVVVYKYEKEAERYGFIIS